MTSHSYNHFDFEFAKVQLFFQSDANSIYFFFYKLSSQTPDGDLLKISCNIFCQKKFSSYFCIFILAIHKMANTLSNTPLWTTYEI